MKLYSRVLNDMSLFLNFEDEDAVSLRMNTGAIVTLILVICSGIVLFTHPNNVRVLSILFKSFFILSFVCLLWLGIVENLYSILYNIVRTKYYS
jgi:hypothetical protein